MKSVSHFLSIFIIVDTNKYDIDKQNPNENTSKLSEKEKANYFMLCHKTNKQKWLMEFSLY